MRTRNKYRVATDKFLCLHTFFKFPCLQDAAIYRPQRKLTA